MPRHIASLLVAPHYALDARMGMQQLAHVLARAGENGMPVGLPDEQERSEGWFAEFIREYGHCHYYVNADGSKVHSLDADLNDRLKEGAIAVVPVRGLLVKECDLFDEAYWGMTSTTRLARLLDQLRDDPRVVGAVQDVFSGGGQVWGTEAYGVAGKAFAAVKPLITHVDHLAASAAYWGAAPSTRIVLDGRTSEVGSIGVMMAWWDMIPFFEKAGFLYREFYAPESGKKNEEWRELREKNSGKLMEEGMSPTAQLFQQHVRDTRGTHLNTADEAVLQGRVYQGDDALKAGLADGYATLNETIAAAREAAPQPQEQQQQPKNMSNKTKLTALLAGLFAGKTDVTQQDIDETNTDLAKEGITNVAAISTAEQERLNKSAELIAAAEQKAKDAEATSATAVKAAEQKATDAKAAADAANGKAEAAEKDATAQREAIAAAATKLGVEVKEGANTIDAIVDACTAAREQVATLTAENTKLKAGPAGDGMAAAVVDQKGDTDKHTNEELSAEEEAFRGAELGK